MLDIAISTAYRATPWPEFYTRLSADGDDVDTDSGNSVSLRQSLGLSADATDMQVEEVVFANYTAFMSSLSL
jgi:hypothetical protein